MKYRRCNRCNSRVSERKVSPGYAFYCPEHDEDLYTFETYECETLKAVNPKVEGAKDDTIAFKGIKFCDEYCPHCEGITFNIPADKVSLCAHCGAELFPCAVCDDGCDWNNDTFGCHRFVHSDIFIRKQKYNILLQTAYEKYKNDWCKIRGYKLADIDEEIGINGECYVCFDEFRTNEFQDAKYMSSLLDADAFAQYIIIMGENSND